MLETSGRSINRLTALRTPSEFVFPRSSRIPIPPCLRTFSTTPSRQLTVKRKIFYNWVQKVGKNFATPQQGGTNYVTCYDREGKLIRDVEAKAREQEVKEIAAENADPERKKRVDEDDESVYDEDSDVGEDELGAKASAKRARSGKKEGEEKKVNKRKEDLQPFPHNREFRSEPILSTAMRDEIYSRIMEKGKTIRQVSQEMQVEMKRVGAVVRMKTMEQDWIKEGKPLAMRYQTSIHSMIPTTPLRTDREATFQPHEPINTLLVHNATRRQLFHPTHETHQFTRSDAAKVFKRNLLPADERIPHPDMVQRHREIIVDRVAPVEIERRRVESFQREVVEMRERKEAEVRKQERHKERVEGQRWQFVFHDVRTEDAGTNGRGRFGVGWRYGRPHMDRRKGEVKIPTKVES
ncbi:MAG: hypothetical protein M1828_000311 [Chrysothrix sp. TS-e1954]|nr:MAG: hypothetical protein M1828_000311 [Chrysothrix sp. TS-e1954]